MLDWKEISIDDKIKFDRIIEKEESLSSRCSFVNLFIWKNKHKPKISFLNNLLLIKTLDNDAYYFPRGLGEVENAIEALINDAHKNNKKLVLYDIMPSEVEELQSLYKDKFEIIEDRNAADYIYTVEKLSKLSGRNLSSKRNHINRFLDNHNWSFSKLNISNLDEFKKFSNDYFNNVNNSGLEQEQIAINIMFDNFEKLEIIGGILTLDEKTIAITAGSILNNICVDAHFEIAIADVQGSYPMINREFSKLVASEYPSIKFINREEDLGLEGLRKAKLSYHPDILLMKYIAKER